MRVVKRITPIFASLLLCFSSFSMPVYAETVEQDGLSVSYTTDKDQYGGSDKVNATLTVKNNNAGSVYEVEIDEAIPEGYKLADGSLKYKSISELKSGESQELKTVFIKNENSNSNSDSSNTTDSNSGNSDKSSSNNDSSNNSNSSNDSKSADSSSNNSSQSGGKESNNSTNGKTENNPKTGNSTPTLAYIAVALAACVVIASLKRGKGKQMLSLLLAISLFGTAIPGVEFKVNAVGTDINVTATVKVDSKDVTFTANVKYSFSEPNKQFDENNVGEIYFEPTSEEHIATSEDGVTMYADNELLVVAKAGVSKTEIMNLAAEYDAEVVGYIEQTGDYQWKLKSVMLESKLNDIIETIKKSDLVEDAYWNYIAKISTNEDLDSIKIGSRWSQETINGTAKGMKPYNDLSDEVNNDNDGESWGIEVIKAPEAWKLMNDNKKEIVPVRVGLVDSGFNTDHEDLRSCFADWYYQDGKNDTERFDNLSNEEIFNITHHGTHVAGTMAANGTNDDGIIGVYPYAENRLYGVAFLTSDTDTGVNSYSENISVMAYKVAYAELIVRNVKVINQSMGFGTRLSTITEKYRNSYQVLGDFFDRTLNLGYDYVLVASAGNNSNGRTTPYESRNNSWLCLIDDNYAIYDRIIVVGSINNVFDETNNTYERRATSDAGERVDVFAPGGDIWSTYSHIEKTGTEGNYSYTPYNSRADEYYKSSGTSMAAPHVAGVAANIWSVYSGLSGKTVKDIICQKTLPNVRVEYRIDNVESAQSRGVVDCEEAVKEAFRLKKIGDGNGNQDKTFGVIEGWVYEADSNGNADKTKPIENAIIKAYNQIGEEVTVYAEYDKDGNRLDEIKTDNKGHYEFFAYPGTYRITASKNGYNSAELNDVTVESEQVHYVVPILLVVENGNSDSNPGDDQPGDDNNDDNVDENTVYLEDMPIIESDQYADNEGDSFVYKIGEHKYTRGNTDIDGVSYTHGLEAWIARWNYTAESSWAYSVFDLGGKYSSLSGKGVLIKSYNTTNFDTTLDFIGDGKLIKSYHLTPDSIPFDIVVDVSGVKQLKVYAYDNKEVSGGTSFGLTGMTLTTDSKTSEYSESELKSAVEKVSDGRIGAWAYADYDKDGNKEAFAVVTKNKEYSTMGGYKVKAVYYVDHNANTQLMDDTLDWILYEDSNPRYLEADNQGFFNADMGAYGSGWTTILYSIKNGSPYELQLSQNIQGFHKDSKGFYTTENDFSQGFHDYPEVNLIYDSTNMEFTKGSRRIDDDIQRYKYVLDAYYNAIEQGVDSFDLPIKVMWSGIYEGYDNVTIGLRHNFNIPDITGLSAGGYTFIDVNNDGTNECIISAVSQENGNQSSFVQWMFTIVDDEPVCVLMSTGGSGYNYYNLNSDNNSLIFTEKSGIYYYAYYKIHFDTNWNRSYEKITREVDYQNTNNVNWTYVNGNESRSISESEFLETANLWTQTEDEKLSFKYFNNYKSE